LRVVQANEWGVNGDAERPALSNADRFLTCAALSDTDAALIDTGETPVSCGRSG